MLPEVLERRTAEKDLSNPCPPPLRGATAAVGRSKGDGNGSGGGSPPPLPSWTGSLCSPRQPWPDTREAAELGERRWVRTGRGASHPYSGPARPGPGGPAGTTQPNAPFCGEDCGDPSSGPRVRPTSKRTSPPPAQGRISKNVALHTPRLAPGSEGGGMAGRRGAPRPTAP